MTVEVHNPCEITLFETLTLEPMSVKVRDLEKSV